MTSRSEGLGGGREGGRGMDNSIKFTIKIKWMKTNNTPTIHRGGGV